MAKSPTLRPLKAQRKAVAGAVRHANHRARRAMDGRPMRRRGYKE